MSLTSLFGFLVLLYTLRLLLHALLLGTFNIFDLCLSEKKKKLWYYSHYVYSHCDPNLDFVSQYEQILPSRSKIIRGEYTQTKSSPKLSHFAS